MKKYLSHRIMDITDICSNNFPVDGSKPSWSTQLVYYDNFLTDGDKSVLRERHFFPYSHGNSVCANCSGQGADSDIPMFKF